MKNISFKRVFALLIVVIILLNINKASAQRIYASSQQTGSAGLLCLGCTVNNPALAADGNLETYSVLNVTVGLAAQTTEDLIFSSAVASGTPVNIKLATGNNLLSLTALGGITFQPLNGNTPIGQPIVANTLLSALSNNNQIELTITPQQTYDRVRVSLNGGLLGALSSIYLYEAFYNGPAPEPCALAVDELHGISAGLLNLGADVGGVVNPQYAIDGNINTASTLNAGVGLVGAYAQQTVIYGSPSVIGDSVRVTLGVPSALLQAGVLSDISVATYNANNSNGDLLSLQSALVVIHLLDLTNNVQRFTATFVPTKVFDRVQVTLGGIANVLSTLNFYEAQRFIPSPVIKFNNVVSNNAQICVGGTATLTATAVPNTIFHWYTAATGGSPVYTGATYTTPVLNANTTYYVSAMRNGCTDESERTAVVVTVNAIPVPPIVANNNVSICSGQTATFAATSVAGVTVNWYSAATGGTLLYTGNSYTTTALTQTTNFYAEAASGTCTSPTRTLVTATISPQPAAPALTTANVTICTGNVAALSVSNPQTGFTYNWYSTATGGTALYTGSAYTTPVLNSNATYYVETANAGGCVSAPRTQASVTVVASPPDPALLANNSTITAGQAATIGVTNAQTGVTYNWFTSAAAGTPVFTGTTYQTPPLYSSTTYYVNAVNSTGCTSADRVAVTVNVNINNNSPCTFANTQTSNINGLCIGCGVTNAVLATDADTTTASTISVLAGLVGGYAEQQLQFQQAGYAGDTVKLVIQNPAGLLSLAVLGQIQVTLLNGTTPLTSYFLNSALIKLSLLAGSSNKYAVYIPATTGYTGVDIRINSGVASVLTSLNVYYAIQQFPKPVFNPTSPEICKGSTALINITSPANGGTFNWYTTPTGGTPVYTGTSFTTAALNTNTTYYIEYDRGTCAGPVRYPVQVLVDDVPVAPTVTAQNVTVTSGQPATLNATASNNATIQWFTAATGGIPVATGNTYTTPALIANTIYYAGTATGSCTSTTRTPVTVTVTPIVIPGVSVTPPTVTINAGQTTTFTASSTTPGAVFNWYTTPTGGTSIYTGATYTTPSEFANTTYYAEASIPSTGAVSATRAAGTVTVNQSATNPVACDAAIDQTSGTSGLLCVGCGVSNATGSADADRNTFSQLNVPIGLVGAYAQQTLRFANTGLAGDSIVLELGIPSALASVNVLSQISISTLNGTTPNNDAFSVNGSLISISLLNGTSRFRVAFKAQHNFDRVEVMLNAALAGVFSSLNIYDATQEVASPVISTTALTACQGSQTTLTATAPADVTIKWYTTATGGTPIATGATFTTPALTATTTYYAEASRTADGCTQAVRTPATIPIVPIPSTPVVSNSNVTVCSGQPATFAVTPVAGVTYNWYSAATGATPVFTGNSFTTAALTANASYYVEAESSGQCSSSTRTPVTATVIATPSNAVVSQSAVQTCSGSTATLTATSTQPGVTFNWYTAATGGTPVFTGAQFTTPVLTANTAYFVETANGSCVSPTRTEADVTVNPLPATPTVTTVPSGGQITSGQTAAITASSTTANVTFNWYTTASGGSPVFTGATYTTPALTNNTTYYVEAVSATGCTSTQRTPVTISVNQLVSTACDFGSSQTTDVNGGLACIGCTVTNPGSSVDADTTTFSQLNLPIGVAGYVGQTIMFGDTGNAGDTVTVKIGIPVSLATVGVLNALQIASYNGTTYNGDRVNLSSSLISIQILSGGQTALVKFVPKATFNAIEVRIVSGVSLFSTLNIYYATKEVPAPQIAIKTVNICAGGQATFTVSNPLADVTYKWYTVATGGTSIFTGTTFTTAALTATTTYYVEASRTSNGCANPNRLAVNVNVTPAPVIPTLAQNAVSICAGDQVTLSVNNAGTTTVNWYDAATGGNLLFTGANYQISPIATISYYAEISNGTCTSTSRAIATVTVNPRPAAPGVQSANVTVCAGSPATLQVTSPSTGINYDWFTTATGGASVFTGATFTTAAITQNTIYYVQATDATTGCTNNGSRTAVNITVTNQLTAPVLSATSTTVCNGGSATLSVTNPVNGLQYNWYTQAAGGTAVFTGTTFTVNNLTANIAYYVEAANTTGCTSATRTETDIIVQPVPAAPQIQANAGGLSVCQGTSASLSIVSPQIGYVYNWYNMATGGTLLYTGTQFNTPALTAITTYYVQAAQAGNCNASANTTVTITINPPPADPVLAAASVTVCTGSPATLAISNPQTGVTYNWYDSPAQTNLLFTGNTFVTGPISVNTLFYVSAVNASGCQSADQTTAQVTVQGAPSAPLIANGDTVQTCNGSSVTLAISNPQAGFTYNWYSAATGGTPLFSGTSFTVSVLSVNAVYYAEAVNSTGCISSSRTQININLNAIPVPPTVTAQGGSATPSVCAGSTATLTAGSTTANVVFNWYTQATGGTPVFTGATYTTPPISAATTYYVEAQSNTGSCVSASRTAVQVTINTTMAAAPQVNAGDLSICQNTAAIIHITTPDAGTVYNWYTQATGGSPVYTGTAFTTPVLAANTTYYVSATSSQSCNPSTLLAVNVVIVPQPATPALAAASVSICSGSMATLSIQSPVSGVTYNWYDSAAKTNLLFTGPSYTTAAITASTTFYVDASNGSCSSSSVASAQVIIVSPPTAPLLVNGSSTTCNGSQVTLNISNPQAGTTYNWYSALSGGSVLFTGTSFTTPVVTADITYYAEAENSTGCASATRTPANITVGGTITAPLIAAASAAVCPGSTDVLNVVNIDPNVTINWYSAATGGTSLFTGNTFTTPALTAATTYYAEASTITCTSATRTAMLIGILQPLEAPDVTVAATTSASVTFSWPAVTSATGYQMSIDNGANFTNIGNALSYTATNLLPAQSVTIIVRATGASDCELSANSRAVTGTTTNPLGDQIFVPNAFTPNGDGKNDYLLVFGNSIKSLSMYVYDQWGGMLFTTNQQSFGWDGTYKGKAQPVGVYVYYLEAVLNDGSIVKKKGTIDLLR